MKTKIRLSIVAALAALAIPAVAFAGQVAQCCGELWCCLQHLGCCP